MTYRQIYEVPTDNKIVITLPKTFKDKKKVLIILDDSLDTQTKKLKKLKEAMKDTLFLADMEEVEKDFNLIDSETL